MGIYTDSDYPLKDETFEIIGVCMDVHNELGHGFREVVYKDAIEVEFNQKNIFYEREKEYNVLYKGEILQHNFYADFVVFNSIILEVKAAEGGMSDSNIAQTLNYLKVSGCKVGLLINFGRRKLEYKRLIF
jgi:GxxExxY protein